MSELKEQIRAFMAECAQSRGIAVDFTDEESLVDSEIMDSLTFFRVVAFLEDTFPLRVAPQDIEFENFGTINAIHEYVARKLGASP